MYHIGVIGSDRQPGGFAWKPDAIRAASQVAEREGKEVGVWYFDALETIVGPLQAECLPVVSEVQPPKITRVAPVGNDVVVRGRVVAREVWLPAEREAISTFFSDPRCRAVGAIRAMDVADYTVVQLFDFRVGYVVWLRVSGPKHGPDYCWEPHFVCQGYEDKRLDRTQWIGLCKTPRELAQLWLAAHGAWEIEQLRLF